MTIDIYLYRSNTVIKPTKRPKPSWTPTTTKKTTTKRTTTRKPTTTEQSFELEPIVAETDEEEVDDLNGTKCNVGERVGDDQDCSKYYRCVHEKYVKTTCSVGLMFDTSTFRCNWANIVHCGRRKGNMNYFVPNGREDR